ncbi:hypothetical protein ACIOHE_21260 [Streptomyces sp. NPDC087851]|uniref:hypothetical protein n=1 Tax=Streptomyces sp. NPDC087851 TaxID=3365810 RepID=UPI00382C9073
MDVDEPELTPFERELQAADPSQGRGHTPVDGVAEPAVAPSDPASAGPAATAQRGVLPTVPEEPPQAPDEE